RGMDEETVTDIDADVGDAPLIGVLEEYQVAGLQILRLYPLAHLVLRARHAGQIEAPFGIDALHQAGAVEAGAGRAPAEAIGRAAIGEGRARQVHPARRMAIGSRAAVRRGLARFLLRIGSLMPLFGGRSGGLLPGVQSVWL